jgi:hypothetical protein
MEMFAACFAYLFIQARDEANRHAYGTCQDAAVYKPAARNGSSLIRGGHFDRCQLSPFLSNRGWTNRCAEWLADTAVGVNDLAVVIATLLNFD